jgi:enterochelin esterase-like enzyme
MPGRRVRFSVVFAAAALAAFAGAAAIVLAATGQQPRREGGAARSDSRPRAMSITCGAPALGGSLPAQVYLPPGYRSHGRRYPVVYFLHGLPASPPSYTQNAFIAQALVSAHEPAIVVAPQGARDPDSDREYLNWSPGEDWPQAISNDLTACIDARFHTIADRSGRLLVGLSAGGYGAMNIGLRDLGSFAAVESWSGYFVATDPSGHHALQLGSPEARRAAVVPHGPELAAELAREPALIAFYVGQADDRFRDMNDAFDASLSHSGIPHVFRTYAGGHSVSLWRAQAPGWLTMGLTYLSTGRTVRLAATG